jgi:uncharacterized protein HemY
LSKEGIKHFLFVWLICTAGIFFGEFLFDKILNYVRDSLKTEILQSVIVGFVVSLIWIFILDKKQK